MDEQSLDLLDRWWVGSASKPGDSGRNSSLLGMLSYLSALLHIANSTNRSIAEKGSIPLITADKACVAALEAVNYPYVLL
jgi:hypothetical protein